jgi:hypothetical protein
VLEEKSTLGPSRASLAAYCLSDDRRAAASARAVMVATGIGADILEFAGVPAASDIPDAPVDERETWPDTESIIEFESVIECGSRGEEGDESAGEGESECVNAARRMANNGDRPSPPLLLTMPR